MGWAGSDVLIPIVVIVITYGSTLCMADVSNINTESIEGCADFCCMRRLDTNVAVSIKDARIKDGYYTMSSPSELFTSEDVGKKIPLYLYLGYQMVSTE